MSDKTFREDNYLPCHRYEGHTVDDSGFCIFVDPENNEFYFAYLENDKLIYRSEGYANASGRDNGIASVKKNMQEDEKHTARMLPDGRWILSLKAGNHQEIARSCPVDSEADALAYLPSARIKHQDEEKKTDAREDDYLVCKHYHNHQRSEAHPDFSTFEHDGNYFFALLDSHGDVKLRSERYKSAAARDNGIESVEKNRKIQERFSIEEGRGIYYVVLKAGNHQEIARSCPYKTREEADAYLNPPIQFAGLLDSTHLHDQYLICHDYHRGPRLEEYPDFVAFEKDGGYYFAKLSVNGVVELRSERYESKEARENGMQSVIENMSINHRYDVKIEDDGILYVILKAANNQEIARSCPKDTVDEAYHYINLTAPAIEESSPAKPKRQNDDYLDCEMYKGHERSEAHPDFSTFEHDNEHYFAMLDSEGDVKLRSEGYKSTSARDNGIASVIKNREIKERFSIEEKMGDFFVILKAGNHQEIGRSCPYKTQADADAFINPPVLAAAPKPQRKDDDYLACKMYKGHQRSKKYPDFVTFEHEGHYFFAMLDQDDEVRLRSERYQSAKARDNGIKSVLKNREIEKRWSIDQKMGYYFSVLKAGNHQEIGRSCPEKEKPALGMWWLAAPAVLAADKPKRRDDDYLACKMYKGHQRSKKYPDFATFEHEGHHFFAMLDQDDEVRLRSERYQSANARDNGIKSVLKNREIEKRWSIEEKMGYYFSVLKAANHQEIGRSCPEKEKPALGMWWLAAPAALAAAAVIPPKEALTAAASTPSTVKKAAAAPAAASSGGGFKWWWLLPLLLLIPAFFLYRGCDKTPDASAVTPVSKPKPPVVTEKNPVPPVVDTMEKVVPPPVAAVSCDCSARKHPVFNIPSDPNPKSLTVLGRAPEFGNSHGLSPEGFYNKLQDRHQQSQTDKKFLDDIFTEMGFNGFEEATAAVFSETRIKPGIKANIGTNKPNKRHATVYRTLNLSGKDLEAFKIKAKNGCDMYFMKTCGNHMFYCPN